MSQTLEAPAGFDAALSAANDRALQAAEDAPQDTVESPAPTQEEPTPPAEEQAAEPAAEEKPPVSTAIAGPSREWLELGERKGVPTQLLMAARDDAQVKDFIRMFDGLADEPEPEPKPADELWDVKDEEFDPTDPIHRVAKKAAEKIKQLEGTIEKLTATTGNILKQKEIEQLISHEKAFDSALDELKFGTAGAPERQQLWGVAKAIADATPGMSYAQAAKAAYYATNADSLIQKARQEAQQQQLSALDKQKQETLGGGPAQPAPVKEPTGPDKFRELLDRVDKRAREADY